MVAEIRTVLPKISQEMNLMKKREKYIIHDCALASFDREKKID